MEPLPTVQRLLPTLIFFFSMENANEGWKLWQATTTTKMQDLAQSKKKEHKYYGNLLQNLLKKLRKNIKMTLHILLVLYLNESTENYFYFWKNYILKIVSLVS